MLVRSGWSTSTNRRGAADSGIPTLQKGRLVRAKVLMHSSSICGCCYFVLFFCVAFLLIGLSCSSKPPTPRASPCPSQSMPASPVHRHSYREPEPSLTSHTRSSLKFGNGRRVRSFLSSGFFFFRPDSCRCSPCGLRVTSDWRPKPLTDAQDAAGDRWENVA